VRRSVERWGHIQQVIVNIRFLEQIRSRTSVSMRVTGTEEGGLKSGTISLRIVEANVHKDDGGCNDEECSAVCPFSQNHVVGG
jgi:hypothetical protein